MTRDVLDERQLSTVVDILPEPLPSVIGDLLAPSSPSDPSPSNSPAPSPSPSPSNSPSTPSPSNPPSTPSPSNPSPSNPPPSTPSPSNPPPSPSNPPPSTPSPSNPPPSTPSPSNPPPSPSNPPPSTPTPSNPPPSPASVQSPAPPNSSPSTGSPSDSPSPSSGSSISNGSNFSSGSSSSLSGNGASSSGGEVSSPSSTTPSGPPSSTPNGSSLGTSPTTVTGGSILTGDSTSSPITSTTGASLNSASSSFSSALGPPVKIVSTGSSALPDSIPNQTAVSISGSPTLINNPSSTNGPNGAGPTNNVSSALADPHHQLSSGEIAAITIVVLIIFITLPISVFILRRRSKMHRADRSTRWWFATARTSQLYGDGATEQLIPAGTQTARSSFVTTVDHSESSRPTYVIPPFPPAMAEMGRGNVSRPPALLINLEGNGNNNLEENRYSIGSAGSDHSQYLIVHHRNSMNPDLQVPTPMSVRPFSPSESFAFPKPPEPVAAASGSVSIAGGSSRPTSSATSVTLAPPLPPGLPSIPSLVPLVVSNATKSPSSTNPFEDSTTPTIDYPYLDISVEVVRRPFKPTLPDELAVKLGERVRVLHTFDDGWGLVEKVGRDGREEESGVIPMDCLRKAGEELEELGTGTRSSSCEGPCAF